ncbi:hypothetical protein D3C78_1640950 [compost metagenome]
MGGEAVNTGCADRGFGFVGAGVLCNGLGLANLIAFQMPRALCTLNQRQQLSLPQLVHPVRFVHVFLAQDCIPLANSIGHANLLSEVVEHRTQRISNLAQFIKGRVFVLIAKGSLNG